jgi:hypothetical protein
VKSEKERFGCKCTGMDPIRKGQGEQKGAKIAKVAMVTKAGGTLIGAVFSNRALKTTADEMV